MKKDENVEVQILVPHKSPPELDNNTSARDLRRGDTP